MSKITIIEGNSSDKDNTRAFMVKGERGYSAYDIAVQNGYTGTEEEWVNSYINATNYYNKTETDTLLNGKVNTTDVVDNLTSTNANKPLSANQGKNLKGLVDGLDTSKANVTDVYAKTDTYSKTEIDAFNTYSLDEIRIGTWLGKPLYRKVIKFEKSPSTQIGMGNTSLAHGISNFGICINYHYVRSIGYYQMPYYSNSNELTLIRNVGDTYIEFRSDAIWDDNVDYYVILEYTKTTD